MPVLCPFGRFGNQLFQYCYARAYCQQHSLELRVSPWLGHGLFDLHEPIASPEESNDFPGYHQHQSDLIYTRTDVRKWLTFLPSVQEVLSTFIEPIDCVRLHIRRGDYLSSGHVVVSYDSYFDALNRYRIKKPPLYVSEANPLTLLGLPDFLPDFYRLGTAPILFRANSTFSWWAHVLGRLDQVVYAPVIDSKPPGPKPAFCSFVPGNHPRMSQDPACSDLHLLP